MNRRGGGGGFTDVDRSGRGEALGAYLDVVADLAEARVYKDRVLELLELAPGGRLLEVGCGVGADLVESARRVRATEGGGAAGYALGIDRSLAMVAAARGRAGSEGVSGALSLSADAGALPLRSASVDACRADRMLQHVPSPEEVVAELVRVCRPGGRIVLSEPDWGTLAVSGAPPDPTRRVLAALADETRQPWIGRALPGLLRRAGLETVVVEPHVLTTGNLAQAEALLGVLSGAVRAFGRSVLEPDDLGAWVRGLKRAAAEGSFFASLTGFTASGTRI